MNPRRPCLRSEKAEAHTPPLEGEMYHPDPGSVSEEGFATVCPECAACLVKKKAPPGCIKYFDFGSSERLGLPELSVAEEGVLSFAAGFGIIFKLSGTLCERQFAFKGHTVFFHVEENPTSMRKNEEMAGTRPS